MGLAYQRAEASERSNEFRGELVHIAPIMHQRYRELQDVAVAASLELGDERAAGMDVDMADQWDDEHTQVWLAKQDFLRDLSTLSVFDAPDVQALVDRYDVSCESDIDSLWASLSGFATERISREPGLADALAGDIATGLRSLYSFKKAHLGWPVTHTHTPKH